MPLKDRKSFLAATLIVLLIAPLLNRPVFSASLNDAKSQLEAINKKLEENEKVLQEAREKESGILGEIAVKDSDIRKKESDLATLNRQLARLSAESDQVEKRLEIAKLELELSELELASLTESLQKQKELLGKRLKTIYTEGDLFFVQVLLGANDFSDLVTRLGYLSIIADQDAALLERIETEKVKTEIKKAKVEAQKDEIEESLLTLATKTKSISDVKVLTQIKRDQIQSDLKQKKVLLTKVQRDRAAAEKLEADLSRTSSEISAYIKSLESGEPAEAPTSPFKWPTSGPITSGYGMRFHPILKVYKMHTGVDIGASYGQSILSAQDGTVIFAGWQGGYGRTIIVDHGGGISTLYAHTSAVNFNVGQKVKKGDIIALVGSTGYSTGPHLHFEIRQAGEPKNPMNWF